MAISCPETRRCLVGARRSWVKENGQALCDGLITELIMKLIRLQQVMEMTGLGRSTIYKYISDEWFPRPVPIGGRSVGWVEREVDEWIIARIKERDTNTC